MSNITIMNQNHTTANWTKFNGTCTNMDGCTWSIMSIYIMNWFALMFPYALPLARSTASVAGATFCIGIRFIFGKHESALELLDLDILVVLFATMIVAYFVEKTGFFDWIKVMLASHHGWIILLKLSFLSALMSAVFRNDSIAIVFTPVVVEMCQTLNLPYFPYLLALATSSNIGSALAPTGNPQNAKIQTHQQANFNYGYWVLHMSVPVLFGLAINTIMLLLFYRDAFIGRDINTSQIVHANMERTQSSFPRHEDSNQQVFSITSTALIHTTNMDRWPTIPEIFSNNDPGFNKRDKCFSFLVLIVMIIIVVSFIIRQVDQAGFAIVFAMILMLYVGIKEGRFGISHEKRDEKTEKIFEHELNLPLLMFFIGQGMLVKMLEETGVLEDFIHWILGACMQDNTLLEPRCSYLFSFVVLIMSNFIWNVPLISVMIEVLEHNQKEHFVNYDSGEEKEIWLMLAWTATVAGNFFLIGSAANMIIAASAARKGVYKGEIQDGYHDFATVRHMVFGVPSTALILFLGVWYLKATIP